MWPKEMEKQASVCSRAGTASQDGLWEEGAECPCGLAETPRCSEAGRVATTSLLEPSGGTASPGQTDSRAQEEMGDSGTTGEAGQASGRNGLHSGETV